MEPSGVVIEPPSALVVGDIDQAVLATLEEMGFTIQTAAGGAEALATLMLGPRPRLLVLDMRVPERMDRLILAALKTQELSEIPVVILSEVDDIREDPIAKLFVLRSLDAASVRRISKSAISSPAWSELRESGELSC